MKLAYAIREAAPDQEVILTVHEFKRLPHNAAELMTPSGRLQSAGVQLGLLSGPLSGIYDPNGMGAIFSAVQAAAQIKRNYIREKSLEGQVTAAAKGRHGGRPKVIDDDSLPLTLALKGRGVPVSENAKKLTIKTGKNAGQALGRLCLPGACRGRGNGGPDRGACRRPAGRREYRPGQWHRP